MISPNRRMLLAAVAPPGDPAPQRGEVKVNPISGDRGTNIPDRGTVRTKAKIPISRERLPPITACVR